MAMVTSKKMIAICKYGGEFDTSEDGLMLYSGGEAYAVDLVDNMQLSDFKQEIAESIDLTVDEMLVKYFLPGNNKNLITVSKEKDFERMVSYYKDCEQMEVFIMKEAPPTKTPAKKQPPRRPQKRPAETQLAEVLTETQLAEVQTETQVAVVQPPVDLGLSNLLPLNEFIDIETTNEIMPSVPQVPINSFPMSTNNDEQHLAAKKWENLITGVGQRFHSLAEFRETLRKYSIAHGFNYMYKKNENQRVTVKCKSEGCPWRIHASKLSTTQLVCIKTMTPTHTCQGGLVKPAFRATRSWVGNLIKEKVKDSPKIKPKDIAFDLKRDYGIELNYSQARRAKEYAREQLLGSYKDAYSELPYFCEKLIETNPGSRVTFYTNEDSSFHRLFVSFHASISGFVQGCPSLLFLDSTPLNSRYQGTLLTATSADGNDEVFPVAFGVIDDETDDNWRWFLTELRNALPEHLTITFVADFQKGLRESVPEIFGDQCFHAYCLGYLAEKFVKDLTEHFSHEARRLMVEDLYAAAQAMKLEVYEKYTQDIKAISPEAYNWIIHSEPEHWANCFFRGIRYNHMTANFGNGFYSWVSEANELPITQLIDELRGKMMQVIYDRRVKSSEWKDRLTPFMETMLKNEIIKSKSVRVFGSHENKFEVQFGEIIDVVEVGSWACSCREWVLNGLPCCHAIAVMEIYGSSPYDFCATHCLAETYQFAYANSINPVPYLERLTDVEVGDGAIVVTPPATVRTPGRAKIRKVVAGLDGPVGPADFLKRVLQCGKCKGLGHNKRSCKEDLQ
ncbi:PB1 domain-containing protein [Artemisia annua]|uniref:PB1 domain-containing protein n=1 Tax=Artemisia annua TaxID=35608 RepID=A0A2U1Q5L2_ARTAN|nr:PB1 domain-containing protein [Artemisia annua]